MLEMLAAVAPFDHRYVNGPVPPEGDAVAVVPHPEAPEETETDNAVGCVMVTFPGAVHPFASVIVKLYVPAGRLLSVAPVVPVDHE